MEKLAIVCIIVAAIFIAGLLILSSRDHKENFTDASGGNVDQNFLDKSLWEDKIPNRVPGPGTDFTGRVIYASADLEAGIVKNRNDIENMRQNLPGDIGAIVEQQVSAICGGKKRIVGE